jgi:hypothetical protein
MGPQKEIAKPLRDQDADDGLALQGNPGMVHADGPLLLEWADAQQYRDVVRQTYETPHAGHGREERRRTTGTTDLAGRRGAEDWVGLQTVAMVEAWRTQGDAVSYERRDYISSLGLDAKQMAESGRGHWAIETAAPLGARPRLSRGRQPHSQGARPRKLRHAQAYRAEPAQAREDEPAWHEGEEKPHRLG